MDLDTRADGFRYARATHVEYERALHVEYERARRYSRLQNEPGDPD
jgi:hypothetical protein